LLCALPLTAHAQEVQGPQRAGGASSDEKAPSPSGTAPPRISNIEDASLEGLLDLNLEDKLGKTEAVSRTSESVLRAPAAITTIDAMQIRLSGATTVADVLRSVPGVAVVRTGPGNHVVSLRGTGGIVRVRRSRRFGWRRPLPRRAGCPGRSRRARARQTPQSLRSRLFACSPASLPNHQPSFARRAGARIPAMTLSSGTLGW
jgi:hypothetical protein